MPKVDLRGRDLITTQDWSVEEIDSALKLARELKLKYCASSSEQNLLHVVLRCLDENQGCLRGRDDLPRWARAVH
jgi:hypothetical protein